MPHVDEGQHATEWGTTMGTKMLPGRDGEDKRKSRTEIPESGREELTHHPKALPLWYPLLKSEFMLFVSMSSENQIAS